MPSSATVDWISFAIFASCTDNMESLRAGYYNNSNKSNKRG